MTSILPNKEYLIDIFNDSCRIHFHLLPTNNVMIDHALAILGNNLNQAYFPQIFFIIVKLIHELLSDISQDWVAIRISCVLSTQMVAKYKGLKMALLFHFHTFETLLSIFFNTEIMPKIYSRKPTLIFFTDFPKLPKLIELLDEYSPFGLIEEMEILYQNVKKMAEDYYPFCSLRNVYVPTLLVFSPEDCEIFLSTPKHTRKSMLYNFFKRWLKDGLLVSSGEKWQQRRKILTPAFHFSILKDFISVFNEKSEHFVKAIAAKANDEINVVPELQEFSLLAINETAMGHKESTKDAKHKTYRKSIAKMETLFNQILVRPYLNNVIIRLLSPFYWNEKKLCKILHNYTETIIKERMKQRENYMPTKIEAEDDIYVTKKRRRMAMLDILLDAKKNGNQIDYAGICEEVDTFTFEGHDTVSTALSFCMLTIANQPEIQEQILDEINSILNDDVQHTTFEDLQKMDLLERCIKETLRLYPSVHLISRIADEDTKLSTGQIVPKETLLAFSVLNLHRNSNIYPDPEKFDPDRFLPDNCLHRHPYAYLPFSAGPRNCIGQRFAMLEMKVLLSAVIRNFKLVAVDTPESVVLKLETILRSKNGVKVKFIPRK